MIHLYCWLNNMHTYRILSIYTGSICSLKGLCRDTLVYILLTGVPSICCFSLASTTHPSSFGKLSCPCGSDGGADYSSHLPGHWKRHITSPEFFELKVEVIALPCPPVSYIRCRNWSQKQCPQGAWDNETLNGTETDCNAVRVPGSWPAWGRRHLCAYTGVGQYSLLLFRLH